MSLRYCLTQGGKQLFSSQHAPSTIPSTKFRQGVVRGVGGVPDPGPGRARLGTTLALPVSHVVPSQAQPSPGQRSFSLTHILSHTHSLTHSLLHTQSLTHTPKHTLQVFPTMVVSHTLSRTHSLSHSLTHTLSHTLSHSFALTHTLSHTLSHTALSLSLSLTPLPPNDAAKVRTELC